MLDCGSELHTHIGDWDAVFDNSFRSPGKEGGGFGHVVSRLGI